MDLTKLVAFLETGSLYFARADTFGDPYEGSWTRLNKAAEEQQGFSKQREETGGYKPRGITVDIDFDKVVETIRVQPTTPAWARQAIEKLLTRYGWDIKVISSQIDIPPTY